MVRLRSLQKTLGDLHDQRRLRQWLRGQYECYLVTGEMRTLLKAHKRHLLKRIKRLHDSRLTRGGPIAPQ